MKYILTLILILFPFSAEALTCSSPPLQKHIEVIEHFYLGELSDLDSEKGLYTFTPTSVLKGGQPITKPVTLKFKRWPKSPVTDVLAGRQSTEAIMPLDPENVSDEVINILTDCVRFPIVRHDSVRNNKKYPDGNFLYALEKVKKLSGPCKIRTEREFAGCIAVPSAYLEVSQPMLDPALDIDLKIFGYFENGGKVVVSIYRLDHHNNVVVPVEEVTLEQVQDNHYHKRYTISEEYTLQASYLVEYKSEISPLVINPLTISTWTTVY